jgi:hypothetical protein
MMRAALRRYLRRERALTVALTALRLWESRAMILESRRRMAQPWARSARKT